MSDFNIQVNINLTIHAMVNYTRFNETTETGNECGHNNSDSGDDESDEVNVYLFIHTTYIVDLYCL